MPKELVEESKYNLEPKTIECLNKRYQNKYIFKASTTHEDIIDHIDCWVTNIKTNKISSIDFKHIGSFISKQYSYNGPSILYVEIKSPPNGRPGSLYGKEDWIMFCCVLDDKWYLISRNILENLVDKYRPAEDKLDNKIYTKEEFKQLSKKYYRYYESNSKGGVICRININDLRPDEYYMMPNLFKLYNVKI